MKFLENFNLGKYNLILFGILFVFMFHQYWYISNISKSTMQIKYKQTEHMSNISNDIKEAVKYSDNIRITNRGTWRTIYRSVWLRSTDTMW